eukprot:6526289-Lingulodinium_polyedra.AAC.1
MHAVVRASVRVVFAIVPKVGAGCCRRTCVSRERRPQAERWLRWQRFLGDSLHVGVVARPRFLRGGLFVGSFPSGVRRFLRR